MTDNEKLATELEATARRYEDTMGLTREGAIRRVEKLHDALLDAAGLIRTLAPTTDAERVKEAAAKLVEEWEGDLDYTDDLAAAIRAMPTPTGAKP